MGEISHPRLKEKLDPFVWLAPAIAIFTVFLLFPILFSFVLSMFNWQGYTKDIFSRFIGLKNCGHEPWNEKKARRKFLKIMRRELRDY